MNYGYIRVSTDRQATQNQQFEIEQYCARENLPVSGWIQETISGTKAYDKRALGRLLRKVKEGDLIICTELSRLGKSGSYGPVEIRPSARVEYETLKNSVFNVSATQSGKTAAYSENVIDQATIDANGLLFLPAAGYRSGAGAPSNVGANGAYWSATSTSASNAYRVYFSTAGFNSTHSNNRYNGNSVRLASVVSE